HARCRNDSRALVRRGVVLRSRDHGATRNAALGCGPRADTVDARALRRRAQAHRGNAGHLHQDALQPPARVRNSRGAQPGRDGRLARFMSARPAAKPARGERGPGTTSARFRLRADCAPVMIWVAGPDSRGVYFNRPWLDFSGRPLESELGHGWTERIHPEDAERCRAAYARGFAAASPFEVEY